MGTSERRAEPRFEVYCPTEVTAAETGTMTGVTRNVSTTGVLVMTHRALPVGAEVDFDMLLEDVGRVAVTGRVVRQSELDEEAFWNYQSAVALCARAEHIREPVASLAAHEAWLFS